MDRKKIFTKKTKIYTSEDLKPHTVRCALVQIVTGNLVEV
jgi:hypothetical protein